VRAHWQGILPADQIERMAGACDLRGDAARTRLSEFRDITVPWDAAIEVYSRSTMPKFGRAVLTTFPYAQEVKGHAFGALFSLVYNRGSSLDGPSRLEMLAIYELMRERDFKSVPDKIIAMKRIWAGREGFGGVLKRRDAEALLFRRGLELRGGPTFEAARSTAEAPLSEDAWHLELGSYKSATDAEQRPINTQNQNFESLSRAVRQHGPAMLKSIGANFARELEMRLRDNVCRPGADTVLKGKIETAVEQGEVVIRQVLSFALNSLTANLMPEKLLLPIIDVVYETVLRPFLGRAQGGALAAVGQGSDWLCTGWQRSINARYPGRDDVPSDAAGTASDRSSARQSEQTANGRPQIPAVIPVKPLGFAEAPAKAGTIDALFQQITALSEGEQPEPRLAQDALNDLYKMIEKGSVTLTAEQSKLLIKFALNRKVFGETVHRGGDVVEKIKDAAKLLARPPHEPVDQNKLDATVAEIIEDLGDAQRHVPPTPVVALLKSLKDNRQFAHLTRLADRVLTRDGALLDRLVIPYAQGLIDGGHIMAAIHFLEAAVRGDALTPDNIAEAHGLLGRAHKQIYMNFVHTPRDALVLGGSMGEHLQQSADWYAKSYNPDHAGETSWHGVNLVAVAKRASRDGLPLQNVPDAKSTAQRIIKGLEGRMQAAPSQWDYASIAEAYLAVGDLENSAKYYGLYAKDGRVSTFQLHSTIRQLKEVWGLRADTQGAGAILAGLNSVLVNRPGATPPLQMSTAERHTIATAAAFEFQKHFETVTENGQFSSYKLFRSIAIHGAAVAAIQIEEAKGRWKTHGTAFLVRPDQFSPRLNPAVSYMLTNAHVMWCEEIGRANNEAESSGRSVN
jgi:hypothetical protein